ncbi:MAG: PleD family two-component system response regulator [Gammaproteobacteria bacterium]
MSRDTLRVLVVDDSELQILFEQALLADEGVEFFVARNGAEAIDCARRDKPDLILLDIVMPVMDGIEAARHIRDDAATCDIPIIMVTSQTEEDYMEDAFIGGCNDYVTKPVRKEELLAKVRSLTGYVPKAAAL